MFDIAIKIDHVSKEYRLGAIGGTTLREEFHRLADKFFHRESTSFDFGKKFMALQDINLEVRKGERLGIIGHNGAGKSTLLKLLARVTGPTTGAIAYNGRISSMLEVGTGFHGELTGRENIYMNGAILGMSKREIDSKIDQIIEFAEMEKFIDTPVKRYSSGMYVKLAFAVAAHLDNEILIMDEVLAVGDMKFQQKCLGKMGDASAQEGKTVLYVSHNMGTIRQLCERCIVLKQGRIMFDGDVEKAIELYVGDDADTLKQHIVFDDPEWKDTSKYSTLKLLSADVLHQGCIIEATESKINVNMHIYISKPINDVYLFCVLHDQRGEPVGFIDSEAINFSHTGHCAITVSLPINGLMFGRYRLRFVLYKSIQRQPEVLARTNSIVCFERLDNPMALTTQYVKKIHGSINFGRAEIELI